MNQPAARRLERRHNGKEGTEPDARASRRIISAAVPPSKMTRSSELWTKLLRAAALPAIVGMAIFWAEGSFSAQLFKDAWVIMAVLATSYVSAWLLSSELERFPFINQFEAALYSVALTLLPAGVVLYFLPQSPVRNLALVAGAGCVIWYVLDKVLGRYRSARLAVLPGGLTERLKIEHLSIEGRERNPGQRVDGVVVDFNRSMNGRQAEVAAYSARGVPVFHAEYIHELLEGRVLICTSSEKDDLGAVSTLYPYLKRAIDLLLVLGSLPVVLPIMGATALAIRLESPGPIFFWQERVGRNGEPFEMVKFRSMYDDNPGEQEARYAKKRDRRVTRVGQFIRQYRIDELPQFWNVLTGEMSLIGPRPEQVGFADDFCDEIPHYDQRHSVRPGITGWAQVRQGYAAGEEETRRKLEHDLYYVKHQSFVLDLLIIYLTIKTMLTGFGAR
jgi:lipopolysaccharide/colanic/teichoic acid biosynthesis glycosyltransferase